MNYDVDYACLTNVGKTKLVNEDSVCISRNESGDVLIVVSDGIGGRKMGEYASKIITDFFLNSFVKKKSFFSIFTAKYWLRKKIKEINKIIFRTSKESKIYNGAGATIVVALISKNGIIIMNAGDSRAYLFDAKDKSLKLLSKDHTYLSILKDKEEVSEYQNIILNSIGVYSNVEIYCKTVKAGSFCLLLCSDGLTKNVKEDEIVSVLKNNHREVSASEIVNELIERANKNGGNDNITVACFIRNQN